MHQKQGQNCGGHKAAATITKPMIPIILSGFPVRNSILKEPARLNGMHSITISGSLEELNWSAITKNTRKIPTTRVFSKFITSEIMLSSEEFVPCPTPSGKFKASTAASIAHVASAFAASDIEAVMVVVNLPFLREIDGRALEYSIEATSFRAVVPLLPIAFGVVAEAVLQPLASMLILL